ncbi:MAG TPA: phosphoheptose isomerase [Clostridiales bacterium]|nr:phosphoheptose isomerase [Clostridiales bacterium]
MNDRSRQILDNLLLQFPELGICQESIEAAFDLLRQTYLAGGKVLICGNGGSAADAEHIVGELMKGFRLKRPLPDEERNLLITACDQNGGYLADHLQGALPAISLTGHPALTLAFSNDVAPDMTFAQQVYGLGQPEDTLVALSTSGNSVNVMNAVKVAQAFGLSTLGMTGADGGNLGRLCDVVIRVPAGETYRIQEYHLPIYHALCAMIELEFFPQ